MSRAPDELMAAVRDTDPDVLDADGLDAYLSSLAELRSWLDAQQGSGDAAATQARGRGQGRGSADVAGRQGSPLGQ